MGEPRPGDRVALQWDGETPTSNVLESNLIIVEVEHSIDADPGYRKTSLTLNKTGKPRRAGEDLVAKDLLDIRRTLRHANFGTTGDAAIDYGGIRSVDDFRMVSSAGLIMMRSERGDVILQAPLGNVFIEGQSVQISAPVSIDGGLTVNGGMAFQSEDGEMVKQDMIILRGIPRPIYSVGEGGE